MMTADDVMLDVFGQRSDHSLDVIPRFVAEMLVELPRHLLMRECHALPPVERPQLLRQLSRVKK